MRTHALTWTLELCVTITLLIRGSDGLDCNTAVESLDLSCLLRWDCPHASPNISYSVQTKTQGDPWQDVPWCVWISTQTCDVSPVFSNFELYNMIRLGVHFSPSSTTWMKPLKFDYSDFTFSSPSVSVSWKHERLAVKVQFPCSANRRCSEEGCCPVTKLIDPWTTVTVYNQHNSSDQQSLTVWTQELVSSVEFSGLFWGHNYCAVANFSFPTFSMAASPKSAPRCVKTISEAGMLLPMMSLGICLISLFLFLLLTVFLQKRRRSTPEQESQPKNHASSHDLLSLGLAPTDPCDIHLEFDQSSINSPSSLHLGQNLSLTIEDVRDTVHGDPGADVADWDSGGWESDLTIPPASHPSEETWDK